MTITTANWTNSAGGDWGVASNWSPASVPGINNNVVFGALSPYVVTIAAGESQLANSVAINFAGATVSMTGSSLVDTTTFFNSGVFNVDATGTGGSVLTVGSALNNSGTMVVGNSGLSTATSLTVGTLNNNLGASLSLVGGSTAAVTVTDKGAMTNAGTLSIGSKSSIANAGTFTQTAGSTTVAAGGALTAKSFSVTAGSLTFNNSLSTAGQTYSVLGGASASITFSNLTNMTAGGILTGGTFTVGTNSTLNLPFALTELDATLTLLGSTSVVQSGSTAIDASLTTIGSAAGAAGALNVTGGRSFASGLLLVNKGGLLSVDATSPFSGGLITDNGTVKDAGTIGNNISVTAGGKMILVPGYVAGSTGTVTGATGVGGATLELAASGAGAVTLAVSGGKFNGFSTVTVDSGAAWTVTTPTGEITTNGTTFSALGGADVLTFTDVPGTGVLNLDGVIGFPTINLATGGGYKLGVTTNTLSKSAVTINDGGGAANTVTSTNATGGRNLTYVAGTQVGDAFTGASENDTVKVGGANVGGDTFTGGTGSNTLTMTSASGATLVSLGNVSNFATINLFGAAGSVNNFKLTNTTLTKTVSINDASSNTTIDASSVTALGPPVPGALVFNAGSGTDVFTGGAENDFVRVSAAAIAADTLNGGTGANTLTLTTSGTNVDLTHVSNFGTIALGGTGANTVIVGSATLNTLTATTINDTNSGTTLTTSSTALGQKLTFNGVGTDNFTGGAEDDSVRVTAAKVGVDTLIGGGGNNTLTLSTGGAVDLSHVSGFGTINLAGGANTVTVTNNTLSAGAVTLNGNIGSNSTITVTGTPANALTYNAGVGDKFTGASEADIVNATAAGVSADTLNGGGGSNTLNITTAGTFDITKDSNFGTINLAAGTNVVTATTGEITGNTVTAGTKGGVINNNTLQFKAEGSADLTNVSGVNTVTMAATVATGSTLTGVTGGMTINDAATGNAVGVGNSVTVQSGATGTVTYVATTGHDTFNGGTGSSNDIVKVGSANIATAHLTGSTGGNNMLVLTDAGFFSLPVANVSNFGTVNLAVGNSNVAVADTAFVGGASGSLTINDSAGGGNNLVNASAVTGAGDNALTLNFSAGPGTDFFVGGVEIDKVTASAGALNHDVLLGGSNAGNMLTVSTAGGFTLGGVSNFHTINLAGGGSAVTVTNATLFGGAVTINDGAGGSNTITSLAAPGVGTLTYSTHAGATDTFNGGGENDTVFASGHTAMSGGLGTNAFVFTSSAAATNTITGFSTAGATNELVFSNSAFALGFAGATSTPQVWTGAEATAHFSANTTGTYASASPGFNYNTTTGALDYSAIGSSGSQTLVATLASHPGIATSQLFFIS